VLAFSILSVNTLTRGGEMPEHRSSKSALIHATLTQQILNGFYAPGEKLPPHLELAASFHVSGLTMRNVLARLEREGLITREHGRGTFIRDRTIPGVLVVDDEIISRLLLVSYVQQVGLRPLGASCVDEGLALLSRDRTICMVLTDVHMPAKEDGLRFIRTIRRRYPDLPIATVTAYPDDLAELHGTPDCPYLVLSKPVQAHQVAAILRTIARPQPELVPPDISPEQERSFCELLQQAVRYARRNGQLLAVLVFQDAAGHAHDALPRARSVIRESDTLSVLADDEVALILANIGSRDNAVAVARKIARTWTGGQSVTNWPDALVVGISLYPFDGERAQDLLASARVALRHGSDADAGLISSTADR